MALHGATWDSRHITVSVCRGCVQTPLGLEGGTGTSMYTLRVAFSNRSLMLFATLIAVVVQGDLVHQEAR